MSIRCDDLFWNRAVFLSRCCAALMHLFSPRLRLVRHGSWCGQALRRLKSSYSFNGRCLRQQRPRRGRHQPHQQCALAPGGLHGALQGRLHAPPGRVPSVVQVDARLRARRVGEAARARDEAGGAGHLRHQVARLQERAVPFYGLLDKENCVIARLFPMLRRRLNMA